MVVNVMGSCFSRSFSDESQSVHQPTARVVALDGSLNEFPITVYVSDVLGSLQPQQQDSFFVCSSDTLFYDEYIPRMKPDDSLVSGQLYFVLHSSMLYAPLTSLDMASLAVKASCALSSAVKIPGRRRARVVPTVDKTKFVVENRRFNEAILAVTVGAGVNYDDDDDDDDGRLRHHSTADNINKKMKMGRSVSMRMGLRPSRRTSNSTRRRLTTIDEVDEQ